MPTIWAFYSIKDKHSSNHRRSCMKNFYVSLRKHAADIINFDDENVTINRKETKIAPRCNAMLHL